MALYGPIETDGKKWDTMEQLLNSWNREDGLSNPIGIVTRVLSQRIVLDLSKCYVKDEFSVLN